MNTTYQDQLEYVFGRTMTEKEFYRSPFDRSDAIVAFEFIEQLCRTGKTDLAPFSDDQIGLGLDFVFCNTQYNLAIDFKQANVPVARKVKALRSLFFLFRDVINPRCESESVSILNLCHVFWDVCPLGTWIDFKGIDFSFLCTRINAPDAVKAAILPFYKNIDNETKNYYRSIAYVMRQCLQLSNAACVKSGLYGLGRLVPFLPDIAAPIIDRYLKNEKNMDEQLVNYARAARTGMIL